MAGISALRPDKAPSGVPDRHLLTGAGSTVHRMEEVTDYKKCAVQQWTADPCGSIGAEDQPISDAPPGSAPYLERLLAERESYAPWLADALDYRGASGHRVLDVGCGQGIDLIHLARAGADVSGIDLTPRHVELARRHLEVLGLDAEVRQGDAEALPFGDASFDRVVSNGVLHHTPDPGTALNEIVRVLRPGGELRLVLYHRDSMHYWGQKFLVHGLIEGRLWKEGSMAGVLSSGVERSRVGARPLVRVTSRPAVRRLLRAAGLVQVRTIVRHLRPEDFALTAALAARVPRLVNSGALDRLGRTVGWYVVAMGRRPPREGPTTAEARHSTGH